MIVAVTDAAAGDLEAIGDNIAKDKPARALRVKQNISLTPFIVRQIVKGYS